MQSIARQHAAKRKKRAGDFDDLQAKGVGCLVLGLVLLFVPVLGGALQPLAWILIFLGVAVIALTAIITSARKQQGGTNPSAEPRQVGQSRSPIKKPRPSPETFGRIPVSSKTPRKHSIWRQIKQFSAEMACDNALAKVCRWSELSRLTSKRGRISWRPLGH